MNDGYEPEMTFTLAQVEALIDVRNAMQAYDLSKERERLAAIVEAADDLIALAELDPEYYAATDLYVAVQVLRWAINPPKEA